MKKLKNWELERIQWNAVAEPFLIGVVLVLVFFGPAIAQSTGLSLRDHICSAILVFALVFSIGRRARAFAKAVWCVRHKGR